MPKIVVTTRTGEKYEIDAPLGVTLMEAVRDAGLNEVLALCGGSCSCATCHIYVDSRFTTALPAMSDDENALLDSSDHRNELSRLGCQIRVGENFDGFQAVIAPEH